MAIDGEGLKVEFLAKFDMDIGDGDHVQKDNLSLRSRLVICANLRRWRLDFEIQRAARAIH